MSQSFAPSNQPPKNNNVLIIVIVIAVLLVCCCLAVIVGYFVLSTSIRDVFDQIQSTLEASFIIYPTFFSKLVI